MAQRPFPIDFATLTPDPRPRRYLVLPEGFSAEAEPDRTSPRFEAGPERLLEAFVATALEDKRTEEVRREGLQVELMQKSKILRFRDFITAEAVDSGEGAQLAVYSRAVVGQWDMNVNKKRIERWLEKTRERLQGA